jgi:hypothetical protein
MRTVEVVIVAIFAIISWGGMLWFFFGARLKELFRRCFARKSRTEAKVRDLEEFRRRKAS